MNGYVAIIVIVAAGVVIQLVSLGLAMTPILARLNEISRELATLKKGLKIELKLTRAGRPKDSNTTSDSN